MLNSGKGLCIIYHPNGGELEEVWGGKKSLFFLLWLRFFWFLLWFSFTRLSYIMASWNFSLKCKQEGIIYVHHRAKKSPNSSSSCLSNILKKQNRAQAQFFFAFQVSFKSRDSHDAAILEVEASKCFTSCKRSSEFLQITYIFEETLVEKEPQPLPLS